MIKQGKVARALTWSGFGAMCGVGALLLPLSPTLAFEDKPTEEPAAAPFSVVERLDDINGVVVVAEDVAPPPPLPTPAPAAENPGGPVTAEPADLQWFQLQVEAQQAQAAQQAQQAEQQALNAELQATREMIKQLSRELERAHARLAELEARRGGAAGRGVRPGGMPGERWLTPRKIDPRSTPPGGMPQTVKPVQPMQPAQPKNAPQAGVAPRIESIKPPTVRRAPARAEGKTDRLDALEERLSALLDEVRSLKEERKDDRLENGKPTEALPPATPAPGAPASR